MALVIATNTYADESLSRLRAPARDAVDLGAVLADPAIGAFTVTSLIDRTERAIRRGVEDFLSGRDTDDLVVVYMSGHGIRDKRGRLYFAATDSDKARLGSTAVDSTWLLDQLDDCRARRQVVILDCCFSGAFAAGAKGEPEVNLERHLIGPGRGRAVLTASRAGEYSFEGEELRGALTAGSVFTTGLIEGLRTGAADTDDDGRISVADAYDYAFGYVRERRADQTPQHWIFGGEGKLWLARNPTGALVRARPLPEALRAALDSPHPDVRLGGVATLGRWLAGDAARAVTARRELQQILDTEVPRVAAAARALLPTESAGHDDPPEPGSDAVDERRLEAVRAEAKEIIEAAQREYDEIVARAQAQARVAARVRAEAEQQAGARLEEADRELARKSVEATRLVVDAARQRDSELLNLRTKLAEEHAAIKAEAELAVNVARAEAHRQLARAADRTDATPVRRWLPNPDFTVVARGYVRTDVDRYVAELCRSDETADVEPAAVPVFATGRTGYHRDQVDRYVTLARGLLLRNRSELAALRSAYTRVIGNLARRSQVLGQRLIDRLDRMESGEQDPDRLAELFQLDHLGTRLRRNVDSLLVLVGADSIRVRHDPLPLLDVLRAAQSGVEDYTRVDINAIDQRLEIAGHAVNDLVHLLAELLDNATAFSPPGSTVLVHAGRLGDGAILSVEDHGIGASPEQLEQLNARLAARPPVDVHDTHVLGIALVARLAHRQHMRVELRPTAGRGIVADVLLPATALAWRYTGSTAGRGPAEDHRRLPARR